MTNHTFPLCLTGRELKKKARAAQRVHQAYQRFKNRLPSVKASVLGEQLKSQLGQKEKPASTETLPEPMETSPTPNESAPNVRTAAAPTSSEPLSVSEPELPDTPMQDAQLPINPALNEEPRQERPARPVDAVEERLQGLFRDQFWLILCINILDELQDPHFELPSERQACSALKGPFLGRSDERCC